IYIYMYVCANKAKKIRRGGSLRQSQGLWLVLGEKKEETFAISMYVFQGFACLPWCSSHRYYIIDEFKNWTEAQNYCRKYYYDLATFDNKEEHDQVVQTLRSGGYTGGVWIGLYDDRYSWRWSNGEKNMAYTNWAANEPDSSQSKEACAIFTKREDWVDVPCENPFFFLCYNGN
uniref:C-type lectin domain-containing protein n=1 Tax=Sinocyclocheilus rhinocerous TaxID=307959 RepID=A0A673JFP7_9TELE